MLKSTKQLEVMSSKTANDKRTIADSVIKECFWRDYNLTAEELLLKLEEHDPHFDRFVFSKIIENSRQPSRYLPVLFTAEILNPLLDRYVRMSGNRKRVRLVAANLTGRYELVPELLWSR